VNAERLHAIARAIQADLNATRTPELIRQLAIAARQLSQSLAEPSYQQQFASAREALQNAQEASSTNSFSPAWRMALEELGAADSLGLGLLRRVNEVVERNVPTLSVGADELEKLAGEVEELKAAVDDLIASMQAFHIGAEALAPGEFEIGFLIPRGAVDNEFAQLGQEFKRLEGLLRPLLEVAEGSRPDLAIRSISSSAFLVFLGATPAMALTLAKTLESLVGSYEKIRAMRHSHEEMKAQGIPEDKLEPVASYINEAMELNVKALADELLA
jgi:hypothetical protein